MKSWCSPLADRVLYSTSNCTSRLILQILRFAKSHLKDTRKRSQEISQRCTANNHRHHHPCLNTNLSKTSRTMKFSLATTLLTLTTLALATPAPITGPLVPETIPEFRNALLSRADAPILEDRATSKPKGSKGGSGNTTSAAAHVPPSSALVVGALGLGVVEVLRLWK